MNITAKVVPFSSVVGSSVTLHDESGKVVCQLALLNTGPLTDDAEEWKRRQTSFAEEIADRLNAPQPSAALPGKDVEDWIERNFAGKGRAIRREDEAPYPDELYISMADAKALTRRAVEHFAALPGKEKESVAVKGLDWREISADRGDGTSEPNGDWEADSILGHYTIDMVEDGWMPHREYHCLGSFKSPDEAKAAAQSNYETIVRSALVSQPQPEGEAVAWRWAHADDPFYWDLQKAEPVTVAWIIKQPLYLHPAPALQGAGLIEAFGDREIERAANATWPLINPDDRWSSAANSASKNNHVKLIKAVIAALSPQSGAGK